MIPDALIAPVITGIFALIVGVVGGLMARRGSKLGAREQRAPDVQEMWAQQEADRRMRQLVEDMWWNLRRAFQSYYRRVTHAMVSLNIPDDKRAKFELTATELAAIDAHLPDDDAL
jgi:hypothetical protein